MKKTSMQRLLFECINLLMALLFVIPLGVLVEQLCGFPLYRCCLIPCLAGIGYILGRVSMTRPMGVSMGLCIGGTVIAVILAVLLSPAGVLIHILMALLTLFFSGFFFFSARKAGYAIYAPMAITGILLHVLVLIICTGLQWNDSVARLLSVVSIAFFLLSLFAFSSKGLRKSLHRTSSDRRVRYPAGMQMGNFLLVTGFIIVAAFISNIYPIFNLFSGAFSHVINALIAFFALLSSKFHRRVLVDSTVDQAEQSVAEDSILNAEPKGEAGWVTTMVEIIAFVVVVLVVIYALYRLMMKLREKGVRLPGFLRNFRDRFAPVAEEDYVDETENLFDTKEMLADTRARMKKALRKLRERPQKLEDFPDNRMKLRFAFQQILKKRSAQNPGAAALTPNELQNRDFSSDTEAAQFMEYYNEARYSDKDIPEDAVSCARNMLKKKI